MLLGDSLLELLGLVSGLVLGIFGIVGQVGSVGHVGSVGLPVGLGLGLRSLVVGLAEDLVLLLREGCVGISVVVEILGVRLELLLGGTLGLFLLLLSLLLLLLSLVVDVTGGSSVALVVSDPVG